MAHRSSSKTAAPKRRSRKIHERSRIALFDVFRLSFEAEDAKRKSGSTEDDRRHVTTSEISGRSTARRIGVDEAELRNHVRSHLANLMNSIRLDAAVPLDDTPNVAASVVNYGFTDLSDLSREEFTSAEISKSIKQSLMDHEPRLVPSSIEVRVDVSRDEVTQRVGVHVTADLIADPADIPVEFRAEIDGGSGKAILNSNRI